MKQFWKGAKFQKSGQTQQSTKTQTIQSAICCSKFSDPKLFKFDRILNSQKSDVKRFIWRLWLVIDAMY